MPLFPLTLAVDDVHVHLHLVDTDKILQALGDVASDVSELRQALAHLRSQGDVLMATIDDMQAQVTAIRDGVASIGPSLTDIAADIDRIKAQLTGGLTAAEAVSVQAELTTLHTQVAAVATAASDLATSNPNP